jgi:peroxiredoxin
MNVPALQVGRRAPDFSLPSTRGPGSPPQRASLGDFQDRWLLLLFYSRDFSLV